MRPTPLLLLALLATDARAVTWRSEPPNGRIVVHALKKGVFSFFAHDHHFEVTSWRATAEVTEEGEPSSVHLVLSAGSLRDRQPRLSEEDRRKVDAQAAGPDVLDAEHHPRIEFRSERFDRAPEGDATHARGTLHGTLTAHGRTIPLDVSIDAERLASEWRVRGNATLKQSALGIEPFSGFGGTVAVKDEVRIEAALILGPGEEEPRAAGRPGPWPSPAR